MRVKLFALSTCVKFASQGCQFTDPLKNSETGSDLKIT